MKLLGLHLAGALAVLASGSVAVAQDAGTTEFFETHIRPLFAEHCFKCHGDKRQRGDLRLDQRSSAFSDVGIGPRIVPGDPAASVLMRALEYDDVELQMPPRGRLDDADVENVRRWIEAGAPWPDHGEEGGPVGDEFDLQQRKQEHWAWAPIQRTEPPEVSSRSWSRNPVDQFIAAAHTAEGLKPAGEASKRTLVRRLSFDLTGLPPTEEQVDAFLKDRSSRAYDKLVDRFLESPHFGERWARHWMDLTRYAETYGHEFDYPIHHVWRYRDYLIRAFNDDVPYDQFMTEHIAGDLIEEPRRHPDHGANESIVATGFWFLNQATHAPVDVRQDTAERMDNQIDVFTKTFLGMTVACARCHDHKFDAISTADYYSLAGFLKSTRQQHALLDPHGKIGTITAALREAYQEGKDVLHGVVRTPEFARNNPVADALRAADEVMYGEPKPGETPDLREPILFEDFESGTYDRWSTEGAVFEGKPATGTLEHQNPVSGFEGKFLVNTFVGGDDPKGRARSEPFKIERNFIRFLIGGGAHKDRTCLNLKIGDKVVRTQTGHNSEELRQEQFDVREFQGQRAVLEIVDEQSGHWGHVNVDRIEFLDDDSTGLERRSVKVVARERGLDHELLRRWVNALKDPSVKEASHPLHSWGATAPATAAEPGDNPSPPRPFEQRLTEYRASAKSAVAPATDQVFAEFDGAGFDGWSATGEAFGDGPTAALGWDASANGFGLVPASSAHSGVLSPKHQGVLRSPSFVLDSDFIHYRLAGRHGQIRVIVEGYRMDVFNGLLFNGLSFNVNTDGEMRWHRQSVARHRGHRAHIELIDHHGDGFVAVDRIVFSDRDATPHASTTLRDRLVHDSMVSSRDGLADWFQQRWTDALFRLQVGRADSAERGFVHFMLESGLADADGQIAEKVIPVLAPIAKGIQDLAVTLPDPMKALAAVDGTGVNEHVYIRGRHNNLGEEVPRQMLVAIAGEDQDAIPRGSGRMELARRMLDRDNPLPARVRVNRVWHHLFGRGLAAVPDNLGVLGEPPTHPELLDWLADWYRTEAEWSTKELIRLLVTSRTYRMSSEPESAANEEADPTNDWLHRMRIRRLEGEAIRDAVLAVSGTLNPKVFGTSVPIHLTEFMDGRGRPGRSGPLDGEGRRSLYIETRRNFLSPMMMAFDAPIPFTTIGRRTTSNVPAQALILMNDPFILQEATRWAERTIESIQSPEQRISHLYVTAFARPPTRSEKHRAMGFLKDQGRAYELSGDDLWNDTRVWADFCHVLMNVKEFTFLP